MKIINKLKQFLWEHRLGIFLISLIPCSLLVLEYIVNPAFKDIFPFHYRPFWYQTETTAMINNIDAHETQPENVIKDGIVQDVLKKDYTRIYYMYIMDEDYYPIHFRYENGTYVYDNEEDANKNHIIGGGDVYFNSEGILYNLMWKSNLSDLKEGDYITIRYDRDLSMLKDINNDGKLILPNGKFKSYIVDDGHYTIFGIIMVNIFYLGIFGLISSIFNYTKQYISWQIRKKKYQKERVFEEPGTDMVITKCEVVKSNENELFNNALETDIMKTKYIEDKEVKKND